MQSEKFLQGLLWEDAESSEERLKRLFGFSGMKEADVEYPEIIQ